MPEGGLFLADPRENYKKKGKVQKRRETQGKGGSPEKRAALSKKGSLQKKGLLQARKKGTGLRKEGRVNQD